MNIESQRPSQPSPQGTRTNSGKAMAIFKRRNGDLENGERGMENEEWGQGIFKSGNL